MKCPKCRFKNLDGAKFCIECGTKFELPCPACGFGNSPSFKFCAECGHSLIEDREAHPIDFVQPHSYTAKGLADKILMSRSSMECGRKAVTVMFVDVADSTTIGENLDPEDVHQIMDGCFTILMDEIRRHEGTINQFTGDVVMKLFGAPITHEEPAQPACYASLAIHEKQKLPEPGP